MQQFDEALQYIQDENCAKALTVLENIRLDQLSDDEKKQLEQIFEAIPEKMRRASMNHCAQEVFLHCDQGDYAGGQQWFNALVSLRESKKEGSPERVRLENYICLANVIRPQSDNAQLLLMLSILYNDLSDQPAPLCLSATAKCPSVLRGRKDLSEWGKNYRAVNSIVQPMMGRLFVGGGKGISDAAIAELLYEKNDLNGATLQVSGALNTDDPDISFAGLALLARLCLLDPSSKAPEQVLDRIGKLLEERKADYLVPNYLALRARFDICAGRLEQVAEWVESCSYNEMDRCCPGNFYEMHTLARALIAMGRYREAGTLLANLLLLLKEDCRPLDTIDCLVESAIVCELMGSEEMALERLEQALNLAQPYGYIRVFADKGKPLFHLMMRYARERQVPDHLSRRIHTITESAKIFSLLCPAQYAVVSNKVGETPELTASEVQILQMLDEGKTNKEISELLKIKQPTVKFHLRNLFEKLGATSRTSALSEAKKLNIL